MTKHLNFCWLLFLSCLLTANLALANTNEEDAGLEDNMTYHLYDDVDLVSTLKFEYGKPRIIIKSVYPQLVSETEHEGVENFNRLSIIAMQNAITEFRAQVKDSAALQKELAKEKMTNNLYIDYNTSYVRAKRDHIISVRFSMQSLIAGYAHGFHRHEALNYNIDKSQFLQLSDLFIPDSDYLGILSNYTRKILQNRLKDKEMINEGTSPRPENFAVWNIKPNGILITFDNARVAPRVYGAQTVFVPYSVLAGVISSESPISDCIQHQARCTRNNVLTGGFIDEASNSLHRGLYPLLSQR